MSADLISRRGWLQLGSLSLLTGMWPRVAAAEPLIPQQTAFARRCIFIMLQGGPSHVDLWDPKPQASEDVRGPFRSISTAIPGTAFGELMPRMASLAHHLTVIRSMTHQFTNHIAGTYITLTGSENQPDRDREAHSDDFPGPGAILNYLPGPPPKVPRSVSLPNWLSIPGPSNRMPGQYGGMLGGAFDPFLIDGDPNQPHYDPLSLNLPTGMSTQRLEERLSLLQHIDRLRRQLESDLNRRYDRLQQSAYDLVADGRVRSALDLSQEPTSQRDRYGRRQVRPITAGGAATD